MGWASRRSLDRRFDSAKTDSPFRGAQKLYHMALLCARKEYTMMTTAMARELRKLTEAGFSIEDAVAIVAVLHDGIDTQPKAEKVTAKAKAQPKAESKAKATPKVQPKAEKATATKVQPKAENGKALLANCKFVIEQTVRTDDPTVTVWRVSLAERVSKSEWVDLNAYFGATFDAGYWRGGWSCPVDPAMVLAGGTLTAKQSKIVADRKAARMATREARKSARKGA